MKTSKLMFALLGAAMAWQVSAHEVLENKGAGQEQRAVLMQKALPEMAGKQGTLLTVRYAPGQASTPHEHPGSVFAYVLEGTVTSQLEGEAPVTYKAGQSWYEPPHAGHIVSKNASQSAPATLVVFLITGEGEAIAKPR